MRARIHKPSFRLEYDGSPAVWNELLRPMLGGPEAPPDPAAPAPSSRAAVAPVPASAPAAVAPPAAAAAAAPQRPAAAPIVRTFAPEGDDPPADDRSWRAEPAPRRFEIGRPRRDRDEEGEDEGPRAPWRRRGGPEPEARVDPSNDPETLYGRLEALGSRRAEKDAVLAAVWFVGQDDREVHEREVAQHLREHGGPADAKIRPTFLKHITRTKLLEPGTQPGLVRLTRKGREQVRLLCGV